MEDKCSRKVGHSWKGIAFPQGRLHPRKYRVSSFSKGKKLFSSWLIIPCLSSMFPAAKRLWAQLSILTPDTMKPSFLEWWSRVKICVLHPKNEKEWRIFSVQGSFNLSSSSKHLLQIFRTFGALNFFYFSVELVALGSNIRQLSQKTQGAILNPYKYYWEEGAVLLCCFIIKTFACGDQK